LHRAEVVELTQPKLINEVTLTKAEDFMRLPRITRVLKHFLGDGLFTAEGAVHKVRIQACPGMKLIGVCEASTQEPHTSIQFQGHKKSISSILDNSITYGVYYERRHSKFTNSER
jgi:hypothetical protein